MVNGTSMLSSSTSSSLLLSTAMPATNAGSGVSDPAATKATPGFAELLNGLASSEDHTAQSDASSADAPAQTRAASLIEAATASGKILPVALPEAAETDAEPESLAKNASEPAGDGEADEAAALVDPLLALLGIATSPTEAATSRDKPAPTAPAMLSAPVPSPRSGKNLSEGAPTTAEGKRQTADGPPSGSRATPAVEISVAAKPEASSVATDRAATAEHKPVRIPELARADAPLPQHTHAVSMSAAQPGSPSAVPGAQAASAPTHVPSPADINAALDRLVAAREALMPAEAALALDHSEFGKISIRFEQAPDGRLSAELRAADPELQRAVTAAVAADRGSSMASEGDGNRPMSHANQRGAAAGGDAASGERGQTGPDRDPYQRPGADRSPAHGGKNDQRPGVFA